MDRSRFESHFRDATAQALSFARQHYEEPLPDAVRFRLLLNSSHGVNAADEFRTFPVDSGSEVAAKLAACTPAQALEILWRDGWVPQWVDVSVIGISGGASLLKARCCGRFTQNEERLYHLAGGLAPFHIVSPALPPGWEDGQRFSLYQRSECWTRNELEDVVAHSAKVWSLELSGPAFDDRSIARLPKFENLHLLELGASPLQGEGLAGLNRQRKLHHLRLARHGDHAFTVKEFPRMSGLESLDLSNLPAGDWGFSTLIKRVPRLATLSISSQHDLTLDAVFGRGVCSLSIRGRNLLGASLPRRLDTLSLHLSDVDDSDVERLLEPISSLRKLWLRGTPVGDALAEAIVDRFALEYIDLVDTDVSLDCVRQIRARYPALRMHPNPKLVA